MSKLHINTILAILHLTFIAQHANAADASKTVISDSTATIWIHVNNDSGLMNDLPHVNAFALIKQMDDISSSLQERKAELSRIAKESEFNATDSVIALAMPGGILYATVIKLRHQETVKQLNDVTSQLNELNDNLLEFRAATYKRNPMVALETQHTGS